MILVNGKVVQERSSEDKSAILLELLMTIGSQAVERLKELQPGEVLAVEFRFKTLPDDRQN